MSRKEARDILFKLVFELCFNNPEDSVSYENFLEEHEISDENIEFVKEMFIGIIKYKEDLLQVIDQNIKGYKVDRLFKVDLAILLIAAYELMYFKETPEKIIANESVELAKKYSTDKSFSFINAVIASIIKNYNGQQDNN